MELQTISQVSKIYGISPRMLRYYEKAGLVQSHRKEGYAYRVYDETSIKKLRQIIILRKLRIPVKQISMILENEDASKTVEIFQQNINELDVEISALSTVKEILVRFVKDISNTVDISLNILDDESVFFSVNALSYSQNQVENSIGTLTMEDLSKSSEDLMKMQDNDVRIVYLPPMTVAAASATGEDTEGKSMEMVRKFIAENNLLEIKPDLRSFGFDCSPEFQGVGVPSKAYETWVSIPDDMTVLKPLIKRTFKGGLYAAHVLRAWDFEDWRRLGEWVNASDKYSNDWGSPRWESNETLPGQGFEEILNFYNYAQNGSMNDLQLDLLFPIKEK